MIEAPDAKQAPRVRLVTVRAGDEGQRIDNFLARHLKGVPKSHIYRLLRKGEVRVNKGRARADYRLRSGDEVRIPPVRQGEPAQAGRPPETLLAELQSRILHEDDQMLVLNKPSGLSVHGGSGIPFGVIEALRALRPAAPFLELVHRLDRDTSGCLLLAKSRAALSHLHGQLRQGNVDKRYLALCAGRWRGGEQTVSAPLEKSVGRGGERIVGVAEQGKNAVTWFRPVSVFPMATLVEARLGTGRTHQIRVHAAHIGHPLAGDGKYGSAEFNRQAREWGLKRLFLHAHSLEFTHPGSGQRMHVAAPLDGDLRAALEKLESLS